MDETRTERLTLRRPTPADEAAAIDIHGAPESNRYRLGGGRAPAESVELLAMIMEHWRHHGFGYWAVDLTRTGETIGFGGLQHAERDGTAYLNLYYRFRASAWGRGYAPEMARAALDRAAREQPGVPVWIITDARNQQARRVADKLGFVEFRQGDCSGEWSSFHALPHHLRGSGVGTSGATT